MKNKTTQKEKDKALTQISMLAARHGIEYIIIEDETIDLYCEDNDLTLTDEQKAHAKGLMKDYIMNFMEDQDCLNCIDEAAGE